MVVINKKIIFKKNKIYGIEQHNLILREQIKQFKNEKKHKL